MRHVLAAMGLLLAAGPVHAMPADPDGAACQAAMADTERGSTLPAHLLEAIGSVESGRKGSGAAWPWTINVAGIGYFYGSKAEAVAAVLTAQAAGVRSIDVGCMQISLQYHPLAFVNLDQAFDPAINVRYGAAFLQRLRAATGNWPAAIAAYHSSTPDLGEAYSRRVAAVWPLAVSYALPFRAASAGLPGGRALMQAAPDVDPQHVATPEFRARLLREAAFRRARDNALGLHTGPGRLAPVLRLQAYAEGGSRFSQLRLPR